MKKINDSSYQKIVKYKKYKDLYDFSSLECRVSLIVMLILDIIFLVSTRMSETDLVVLDYISYLDSIGIALIGFLGFIVTGLALLTGAISSKIVKRLHDRNKLQSLEKVLLSFYLLGLVNATIVIIAFTCHFLKNIPTNSIFYIDLIILSITSYLIVFSIFYAVKLIGNCLELFYIISDMQITEDEKQDAKIDYKSRYNNYRITVLEKIILINKIIRIEEYSNEIKKLIESDVISPEEKETYLKMHRKQFNL